MIARYFMIAPWWLLLIMTIANPVQAAGTITLGVSELEEIFTTIIIRESVWPQEELSINNFSSFPESVEIPAGILGYRLENDPNPGRLGRQNLDVVLLVNGRKEARLRMSADLQRLGQVLLSSRRINRGEIISRDDFIIHRREISMLDNRVITSPEVAIGMQLRTTLQAGAIIYQHLLESPTLVRRGDRVTIIARNHRIMVNAPGEVREAGAKGDLIKVRNLMSRRAVIARVIDSGLVETDI
ncbi:MAG: flagellar basal body P-ring formation protein FlgA [Desulfobulbaceae bacterium]|nr:MAG: flagellar basal body P-ring formation protein FlgA [Desulfobulbaceae bacterium]